MTNKNIIKKSVDEITELLFEELARVQAKPSSNKAKNEMKLNNVLNLLASVPEDVVFMVEGVRGNGKIRENYIPNLGSVVECIVKYHNKNTDEISKSFDGVDLTKGCIKYEIKSSLSPNALATPSEAETTILVNACGVYKLYKREVLNYVNKQGRLPYNKPCGTLMVKLTEMLGY